MPKIYNWGIVSTGKIANHFAQGLSGLPSARLHAVGSRTQETADEFANKWSIEKAYSSYEALFRDSEIDIIYIGTPHNFHHQNTLDAIAAGKHVLCEKAFAVNTEQGSEMITNARSKKIFLMDAMWNRFQPWYATAQEIIHSGVLGELIHFKADLSFHFPYDAQHRLFNPELAGGSLLDLGVYPITLASAFLGNPDSVESVVHKCPTGMDDQVNMIFSYGSGARAELACSSRYTSGMNPILYGSKGTLEIHGMIRPEKLTLTQKGETPQNIPTPYEGNAYQYEALAVMDSLDKGEMENPRMPLDETLANLEIMEAIRKDAGIYYPGEIQ